jgi:hypothetical protein
MAAHIPSNNNRGVLHPLNVEQITKQAQQYDYNPLIPLYKWLRAAGSLVNQVLSLLICYLALPTLVGIVIVTVNDY